MLCRRQQISTTKNTKRQIFSESFVLFVTRGKKTCLKKQESSNVYDKETAANGRVWS